MRQLETSHSRLTLDDDGILWARAVSVDSPRTSEMMAEILKGIRQLVGSGRVPAMWFPAGAKLEPAAWQLLISRIESFVSAVAIVVPDVGEHGLGVFPIVVDSLLMPARVFEAEVEAYEWLLTHAKP